MNAFYEPFAHAQRKPWVVSIHPLRNALPVFQPASVPIREIWRLRRDTIMYPPVQIIPGVVDQRWIRTLGGWLRGMTWTACKHVTCHIAGVLALSRWKRKLFRTF